MVFEYCSRLEIEYRQRVGDVHELESTDGTMHLPQSKRILDPSKAVKRFVRSGSQDLHKSFPKRTIPQIEATIDYLLLNIWSSHVSKTVAIVQLSQHQVTLSVLYAFVMDRIQAVRQEVVPLLDSLLLTIARKQQQSDVTEITIMDRSVSSLQGNCTEDQVDSSSANEISSVLSLLFQLTRICRFYIHSLHIISIATGQPLIHNVLQNKHVDTSILSIDSIHTPLCEYNNRISFSWFDYHLHWNAFRSCTATCTDICQRLNMLNISQGDLSLLTSIRDEIMSYTLILAVVTNIFDRFRNLNESYALTTGMISSIIYFIYQRDSPLFI